MSSDGQGVGERPNVILIMVDTLSFREVGHLGGSNSTPNIDRFAAQSTVFARAYSTSSWTQPAVASLFTGQFPSRHGVDRIFESLPDSARTLAEELSASGYLTAGIVSNFLLRTEFGLSQGFQEWDQRFTTLVEEVSSHRITDAAISWLRRSPRRQPFFLYVHYMDPHFPYLPHAEFDKSSGYQGRLTPRTTRREFRKMMPELDRADIDYWQALYREEVQFTDEHVGRLLDAVDKLELDNTIAIVTSDHGEEFFEHGWFEHIRTLYEELARVVLVIRWPDSRGRTVETPVSLLALTPSILEAAGIERPHRLDGRSLSTLVSEVRPSRVPKVFLETDFVPHSAMGDAFDTRLTVANTALVDGDLKLIHDLGSKSWSLFDLAADPMEKRDLYGEHGSSDDLQGLLSTWEDWKERNAGRAEEIDPDDTNVEMLRALGYLD